MSHEDSWEAQSPESPVVVFGIRKDDGSSGSAEFATPDELPKRTNIFVLGFGTLDDRIEMYGGFV